MFEVLIDGGSGLSWSNAQNNTAVLLPALPTRARVLVPPGK